MQVRLLGPVDVVVDGTPRDVPGLRRKAVLAALALNHGEVLSTDRLLDIAWGPGETARLNTLQSHVSYLRRVLGLRPAPEFEAWLDSDERFRLNVPAFLA